ncbi:MAG: chromosomal replication initiator protein DnaA [Acidobacteriota bacterium]
MLAWEKVLERISRRVSSQNFDIWFRPTSLSRIDPETGKLVVWVPNRHFRYWLSENYGELIAEAVQEAGLGEMRVEFVVAGEEEQQQKGNGRRALTVEELQSFADLNPKFTFESFVVGRSNQLAQAAALAVAENPSCGYNPLFIYGGVGLGKTHLMHAIGHRVLAERPDTRLLYISAERFVNELIHAIRFERMVEFRERYRNVDVLLMDDVQFLAGKERTQEEFFHTFNALYDSQRQIVLSSDAPPRAIPTLQERLHSRFEWGLIADIQPPDLETKVAILRRKADERGVDLPEDVSLLIAGSLGSNVRELEGALIRLVAYSSLTGRPMDLDLAREALRNLLDRAEQEVTIERIQQRVAEFFSLKVTELKARNSARRVAQPRQLAMFLSKELTRHSLSEIGREFGGKHHTTVLHAIRRVEELQRRDPKLRATLERLKDGLK